MAGRVQEYRADMPLSVEEYRVGQLYCNMEISKLETGGKEGIEIVVNEPFEGKIPLLNDDQVYKGQYSHKVIHLAMKVPAFIRLLAPTGSLEIHEKSWNCYPMTITTYENPYMKDNFHIVIRSFHDDSGQDLDNATKLPEDHLKMRERPIDLNIVTARILPPDYDESEDPTKFKSEKTGRGPLQEGWEKDHTPKMRIYKSYFVFFKWFGLQDKVESVIVRAVYRLLARSYRRVFCWIDKWHGLSLDDIRIYEEKCKTELDEMRKQGDIRGMIEK